MIDTTAQSGPPDDLQQYSRVLLSELKDRSQWFVRVRWWVPPIIVAGVVIARLLGIGMAVVPLLAVALFVLLYNAAFHLWHRRFSAETALQSEQRLRRSTCWQIVCDYLAMFAILDLTGGLASPFLFFFIFHIIFASILLKHRTARLFAAMAALGVGVLALFDTLGWLSPRPLVYGGEPLYLTERALPRLLQWSFFAATMIVSALATTNIMEMVRLRIVKLADLSAEFLQMNRKLKSLYAIGDSLASVHRLTPVLDVVCSELVRVMEVQGVTIKLLSEDRRNLEYAAVHGLEAPLAVGRKIEVDRSPLNRRIIAGESFVTGLVSQQDQFLLGENLRAAGLQSVLFVPLRSEERILGILGAYCRSPERFDDTDVDFLTHAAGMVALSIENARAYEEISELNRDRERFTLTVTHNLRAPLAAMRSILDVISDGYLGELNDRQQEYLRRVDRRAGSLDDLINELLLRAESKQIATRSFARLDLTQLAERVRRTFGPKAEQKNIWLSVSLADQLPQVQGDQQLIERMLENLVSNAIKYTPGDGKVIVALTRAGEGDLSIVVSDTGIGIPDDAMPRLFTEFFRAENAKAVAAIGTGLGLVIIKEIVEKHGGTIAVTSEIDVGTHFEIRLPAADDSPARKYPG